MEQPRTPRLSEWRRRRRADKPQIPTTLKGWALVRRYIYLVVVLLVLVGPIILPLLGAFKAPSDPMFGPEATLIPKEWSLQAFSTLFAETQIVRYVSNSLIVCILNVISHLVLASLGGYMLSRKGWRGRGIVLLIVMSALIFPFESIMLSLYAQVRAMNFYDTLIGVWMPGMLGPFHLLLMRAAFMGIPDEIEDAAYIDGASEWQRFWKVMLPQTKGSLTIVGLTSFIFAWQDYLWPLLIVQSDTKSTMMIGIARLQSSFGTDYRVVLAGAITALIPILVLFFLSQKYFFKGIEDGGLKF
ncbi:MAG: carbohydrate ABC transporter permease [Actinomycetaceae bacterium]|nr:carbohydrate ABC transporter permease [Actinomycetaceae bacterium]